MTVSQQLKDHREGDAAALRIFTANLTWAETIARNVARKLPPSFNPEDIRQEALMETWKRALLYEASNGRPGKDPKGTPFQAYAYMYVRGACLMSIRRRNWTEATHASLDRTLMPERGVVNRSEPKGRSRFRSSPEAASSDPDPHQALLNKAERKAASRKLSRRRAWLLKQIDKLSPVDAHLVKRTYIDEEDLDAIAKLAGVERGVLSRRLAGIVKRLKKARTKK